MKYRYEMHQHTAPCSHCGRADPVELELPTERHFKENNIDLYFLTNEHLHTFCISVYIMAGSMYESKSENGISHLYEHMVYRNLSRIYNNEFYSIMEKNGLYLDASTYNEFIRFSLRGITSSIGIATDILANLLMPLDISKANFNAEKERIYSEIRENEERKCLRHKHSLKVWGNTSNAMTITGCKTNISKITLKKLNEFRETVISAGNMFVYVTGNIGCDGENLVKESVKSISISEKRLNRNNTSPVPQDFGNRSGTINIDRESFYNVFISFDVDTTVHNNNIRDILYRTLFTGNDSLINDALSEKTGYIYNFSSFLEQYSNIGRFCFDYEIEKENLVKSIEAVVNVLNQIKSGDFDLESQIRKEMNSIEFMLDDIDDLNWTMAYNGHILEGKNINFEEILSNKYKDIDLEAVMSAARDIFSKRNLTLNIGGNKKHIDVEKIGKITDLLN